MKRFIVAFILGLILFSCGGEKSSPYVRQEIKSMPTTTTSSNEQIVSKEKIQSQDTVRDIKKDSEKSEVDEFVFLKKYSFEKISENDSIEFRKMKKGICLGERADTYYSEPYTITGNIVNIEKMLWRLGPFMCYTVKNNRDELIQLYSEINAKINGVNLGKINASNLSDTTGFSSMISKVSKKKVKITFTREATYGFQVAGNFVDNILSVKVLN